MLRVADLTVAEKVGQLFWIGFEGTTLGPGLKSLLEAVRPGGVILFARNIDSADQVRALTDALFRALPVPPFIALDQEGGRVSRLRPVLGPTAPAYFLAGRPDPTAAVRRHSEATSLALKSLGFNVNLAPVLDLSGPDPANGIGDRAFGEDPVRVCALAETFLRAHLRAGVIPVGKHFPGLGGAQADTHLTLPVIRRSRARLLSRDLLPYRRLRSILPIVMVGHAYYPALQGPTEGPATLSRPIVEGVLRKRIGFRGLVLTDDLEMGAIDQRLDGAQQARSAFLAGSDGLMFCRSEERIREAHAGMLQALGEGEIPAARIGRSLRRVLALKDRYLVRRRRMRYSLGSVARSRLLLEALGSPSGVGPDPTARP
ncbi:MAG TPA: glycoside hydrolase family 3 N-terminal domain-containing protein [Candidatus Polarisedimenticolia bacterium]|nr:glycoside hydrolase family 3 N-terminal domain-containing protein [Candidatus Polarisedimenticolia bacterium]